MFSLVPVTSNDLPWLFALHKAALKEYVEQIWGWDEDWQRDYFFKTFKLECSHLIKVDDEKVGRLTLEYKPEHVFLAYIALLPDFQNKGIGSAVIRSVMRDARGKPLTLTVLNPNPAISLYERLGFVVTDSDSIRTTMTYG